MSRRTRNILIILAALGLLTYIGFSVYRHYFTFYMTGTSPGLSRIYTATPYMDVNFNKTLVEYEEFRITSVSPEILAKIEFRDKTIRIYFENLQVDATYDLIFSPVRAEDGDEIVNLTLDFHARAGNFEQLPVAHQQYLLDRQDEQPATLTDPILQHLPHSTLSFELTALVTQNDEREDILVLEARLLLNAADVRIGADEAVEQYKSEVVEFIRSLDLDPEDYTIRYQVVEPTLQ